MEGFILFGMAIGLVAWIVIAFGVKSHADKRNKSSLWAPAVFVFGIIGLGAYGVSLLFE